MRKTNFYHQKRHFKNTICKNCKTINKIEQNMLCPFYNKSLSYNKIHKIKRLMNDNIQAVRLSAEGN